MEMSAVRTFIKASLLQHQLVLSRATDFALLARFFNCVRPISTNHDLIRIGGKSDGGYLVPDDLENIEICFSPGVSKISDFKSDLASRGIKCFMADYSVDAPPVQNELFHFEKKFLGPSENSIYIDSRQLDKKQCAP